MTVENTIKKYKRFKEMGHDDKCLVLKKHMLTSPKYKGKIGFLKGTKAPTKTDAEKEAEAKAKEANK